MAIKCAAILLVVTTIFTVSTMSPTIVFAETTLPDDNVSKYLHQGTWIEVLTHNHEIVSGTIHKADNNIIVLSELRDIGTSYVDILTSDIKGIRTSSDNAFKTISSLSMDTIVTDTLSRNYVQTTRYNNLAFMGVAIAAGVATGERLAKASTDSDMAGLFGRLGMHRDEEAALKDKNTHMIQGLVAALVGVLAVQYASRGTTEFIPVPLDVQATKEGTSIGLCVRF